VHVPGFATLAHAGSLNREAAHAVVVAEHHSTVLDAGQCYTHAIHPILSQGSFSAENMHPVSAAEHHSTSGHIHERLRDLPDGAHVPVDITN